MNRGLLDSPVTPNIGGNAAGSVVIDVASDRDEQVDVHFLLIEQSTKTTRSGAVGRDGRVR
jgi:hypothetical protein